MEIKEIESATARSLISLVVKDEVGVMQRICGVFSRRGFNLDSITVGPTGQPGLSRMTIATTGNEKSAQQAIKQLSKLVDVIKVARLDANNCIERETALVKVFVKDFGAKSTVLSYAQAFNAKIIHAAPKEVIVQVTGESRKIDSFVELLKPFGLKQVARTGACAMEEKQA